MRKHERIPGTCTPTCDSNVYELGPRVRLHVTEIKSHSGMKKFLFTRDFHPGRKFNLKEDLPLSMKTY